MKPDPTNLNNLHDIVLPEAPAFWPPAQGFWMLVALVLMLALTTAWLIIQSRKRNAYRRAGLTLLESATTHYDINAIVKRVALAAFPRNTVAHLHGNGWVNFLETTCHHNAFASFGDADKSHSPSSQLREEARTWIRHHKTDTK